MSLKGLRCSTSTQKDDSTQKGSTNESPPSFPWQKRLLRWLITLPFAPEDDPASAAAVRRNYEVWGSKKQIYLFGGHLRSIRARPVSLASFTVVLIPGILYCIFDASWCWHHIHPAAVIMFLYTWIICVSSFIRTSTSDPGYLPRNIHLTEDPHDIPQDYFNVISLPSTHPQYAVDVKYCHTCRCWRMPRTFHCSKCDQCVSIHDHHCKWLNMCIGERNYRYFYSFLLFGVLSCVYLCALCYYRIVHGGQAVKHIPMTVVNVILAHLAMLYPLLLLVYHTYLLTSGETTREYLRAFKFNEKRPRPFSSGSILVNIVFSLFRRRGRSFVSARGRYERGDARFERFEVGTESV